MSEKIITIGDAQHEVAIERDGAMFRTGEHAIEIVAMRAEELEARVDGRIHVIPFVLQGTTIHFAFDGDIYFADVTDKGARAKARHREQTTSAPMPGVVLKLLVKKGDAVTKGQPVLILEAMKMEHQIVAPKDGTVDAINCAEGELVQPGVELVAIA